MPPSSDRPSSNEEFTSTPDTLSPLTQADIAVVQLTPTGEIVTVNDALANLTGYTREHLLGNSFTTLLSTIPPSFESVLKADSADSGSVTLTFPLETADGAIVTCESHLETIAGDDEDDRAIVGTLYQQSEPSTRTDRSRELDRESDAHELGSKQDGVTAPAKAFLSLADSLSEGIIVLDTASEIQYANPAVERILGYTPDELVGGSKLSIIPERLRETHLNALNRYLETGTRNINWEYVELPGQHKDGHEVPLGISLNDFVFEGDRYFVGLFRDITERKEIQQQLEESNERLEQFAYAASHDLQEPLRMVTSYLQLIERRYSESFDEDGEEFLEFAIDGAQRMRKMIEGLLEYSRVDRQGDPLEPVDLDAVLADVRKDLQLQIEEADAEISTEDLPRVAGDSGQLRQVFQNLLSNAIEYSGDNPPKVDISAEQHGEMWLISVRDDGIGIDPAETDRIFRVFQRLHVRDEHAGTGLGLALCQRIVERHGGRIWVESEPGEGSTFFFTLNAVDALDSQ